VSLPPQKFAGRHVCIICGKELNCTKMGWPILACCSCHTPPPPPPIKEFRIRATCVTHCLISREVAFQKNVLAHDVQLSHSYWPTNLLLKYSGLLEFMVLQLEISCCYATWDFIAVIMNAINEHQCLQNRTTQNNRETILKIHVLCWGTPSQSRSRRLCIVIL
jgi:hypothetical protein